MLAAELHEGQKVSCRTWNGSTATATVASVSTYGVTLVHPDGYRELRPVTQNISLDRIVRDWTVVT